MLTRNIRIEEDVVDQLFHSTENGLPARARTKSDQTAIDDQPTEALKTSRAMADHILQRERVTADHVLHRERSEHVGYSPKSAR
jgi:hypothetical protein